jgi:hypothetical protein
MKLSKPALQTSALDPDRPADALLTACQVGAFLGISARQVQRLDVPYFALGRRCRRYRMADVTAWLESRRRAVA